MSSSEEEPLSSDEEEVEQPPWSEAVEVRGARESIGGQSNRGSSRARSLAVMSLVPLPGRPLHSDSAVAAVLLTPHNSRSAAQKLFHDADTDENMVLSRKELKDKFTSDQDLMAMLRDHDKDVDGFIDQLDADGDGEITVRPPRPPPRCVG
jgi:hypothetical protein